MSDPYTYATHGNHLLSRSSEDSSAYKNPYAGEPYLQNLNNTDVSTQLYSARLITHVEDNVFYKSL